MTISQQQESLFGDRLVQRMFRMALAGEGVTAKWWTRRESNSRPKHP